MIKISYGFSSGTTYSHIYCMNIQPFKVPEYAAGLVSPETLTVEITDTLLYLASGTYS